MRKNLMIKKLLSSVLAAALAATALVSAPMSASAVSGEDQSFEDLDKTAIVEAMGPAWNLGNQLEAVSGRTPSETAWGNPTITQNTFKMVKDAGFTSVRIPISYLGRIGNGPDYKIESSWLKRIKEVVDMAMKEDLYAIINMHGDGYTTMVNNGAWLLCNAPDNEQPAIKAKYEACWKQIADVFADYDEHLIFESMNEEFDGVYSTPNKKYYANINAYNQIFVDTVRQSGGNNAKRWLLVPGWNTDINYTCGDYGFEIPTDTYRDSSIPASEQRIMISVHYYNPWDFCGEGKKTEWGTDAEVKTLTDNFDRCYTSFVNKGYPVVIGEYGAVDGGNNTDSRVKFVNTVCRTARSRGMVPVIWDNNGHGTGADKFGLFNRSTFKVTQPEIIKGIMDAYEGEPDPAPVIVDPITKDEALAVVNCGDEEDAVTVLKGVADASLNGATTARFTIDTAADVAFNQYSALWVLKQVGSKTEYVKIIGDSDITGATCLTYEVALKTPIAEGDDFIISVYTGSWKEAEDYVLLIRQLELLDADGNVLKTVKKSDGLPGDVNNDGQITTADVGLANAHAKSISTLTDDRFARADVNGDGKITTGDVGMINSHAKGTKLLW